jgi:RimJ/RimL family protein N-acetyltransferase
MSGQFSSAVQLIRAGHWRDVVNAGRTFISSESQSFGLRRYVTNPFPIPAAKVPIHVRPISPAEAFWLLTESEETLSADALKERNIRVRMAEANLATCYVALTDGDEPTYIQWLMGASENAKIHEIFGERFPTLAADEMLLEGAFTFEAWRGKGIMACAMAQITDEAPKYGARSVITFVGDGNIASLKGCKRCGFEPYIRRTDTLRFFRHHARFSTLNERESLESFSSPTPAPTAG